MNGGWVYSFGSFFGMVIDVLFPLVGWLIERFETTPEYNR